MVRGILTELTSLPKTTALGHLPHLLPAVMLRQARSSQLAGTAVLSSVPVDTQSDPVAGSSGMGVSTP